MYCITNDLIVFVDSYGLDFAPTYKPENVAF